MRRTARSDDQFSLFILMVVVTVIAICVRLGQIRPPIPFFILPITYAAIVLARWSIGRLWRRRADELAREPGE
ncbi:MAG: hypothetical protein WEH44_08395 [Pirellulaceae bacterium]